MLTEVRHFHFHLFYFSKQKRHVNRKKQLAQDLILPLSIYIHMCTLYTYTIYVCRHLVHLDSSGPPGVSRTPQHTSQRHDDQDVVIGACLVVAVDHRSTLQDVVVGPSRCLTNKSPWDLQPPLLLFFIFPNAFHLVCCSVSPCVLG